MMNPIEEARKAGVLWALPDQPVGEPISDAVSMRVELGNGKVKMADIFWPDERWAGVILAITEEPGESDPADAEARWGNNDDGFLQIISNSTESFQVLIAKLEAACGHLAGNMDTSNAISMVARERQRQIREEGFTPDHDDQYSTELPLAAACYALNVLNPMGSGATPPAGWPWDDSWWKPRDPLRDLTRAGALILAEIERLTRRQRKNAH